MHTTAQKLKSQRGASLIFALLVFMLCAFAGAAALVSAAANAGRYARLEQDQQQYLSASSAATLLRDEFSRQEIKIKLTMRHTYTWWYVQNPTGAAVPYTLYSLNQYTFVDPPAVDGSAGTQGAGAATQSPQAACQVSKTGASSLIDKLLPLLEAYFSNAFLHSDVPSYFFERPNEMTYTDAGGTLHTFTDTDPNAGTGSKGTPLESEMRRLVITGQSTDPSDPGTAQWDGWRDTLGTVYADVSDIGDYGLRVEISEHPTDAKAGTALYTTAFELPAQVHRQIETCVTVEDDSVRDPYALVPDTLKDGSGYAFDKSVLRNAASYGQRVTENTVTVTVTWKDNAPVVTRIY